MKRFFSGAVVIMLLVVMAFYSISFIRKLVPPSLPSIEVTYNKQNIETSLGMYNWFNKDTGGNTCFADEPEESVKNLKITSIRGGDTINFVFKTFYKQPIKTTVYMVIPNKKEPHNFGMIQQASNTNYFNVPKEKGEYILIIMGYWDETHSVDYYLKINVQ